MQREHDMTLGNLVKTGAALPVIGGLCILCGCASPMPTANPNEAWVGLREEPTTTLMAEAVDGKRLDDGRYFQVSAGEHTLLTRLFVEGDGDSNGGTCSLGVTYSGFKAGKHYSLIQTSLGQEYEITLYSQTDKPLAHSHEINCLAG